MKLIKIPDHVVGYIRKAHKHDESSTTKES